MKQSMEATFRIEPYYVICTKDTSLVEDTQIITLDGLELLLLANP